MMQNVKKKKDSTLLHLPYQLFREIEKAYFDGIFENIEIWETRFLAHLRALNFRNYIQADARKNARCYA